MIDLSRINNIYIYPGKTDFRKGIPGLRKMIGNNPSKNSLYLFCNKKLTEIKIIEVEENVIWMYQKKLLKNKFQFPKKGDTTLITKEELIFIINGVNLINKIEYTKSSQSAVI